MVDEMQKKRTKSIKEKEYMKEYIVDYYQKNKDKWNKYTTKKIECDICGKTINSFRKGRHQSTKKCKNLIKKDKIKTLLTIAEELNSDDITNIIDYVQNQCIKT